MKQRALIIYGIAIVCNYYCLDDTLTEWRDNVEMYYRGNDNKNEVEFVIWSILVGMFGDWGTSPRSGWIVKPKECKMFLQELIENLH